MKIIAVLPAYNAEKTLEKTIQDIPSGSVSEIILVDDCSKDQTAALARKLGLITIVHEKNLGYGGNQKTCYAEALERGADIVIMIHPDYQYDARLTPIMTGLISSGICDVVCGNRIRTRGEALKGGMPLYKYFFNRFFTIFENSLTGQNLGEWHSGLRAYSRRVLETIPWELNSNDFVFDQQFLIQAAACRFRIGDVPVTARYFSEASSINFRRSVIYGLSTLVLLGQFLLHSLGLVHFALLTPKRQLQ
ncbi:MAG: glycosyl transferase family 2 [Elusimicrobia bacterium RIFCSPHIGHO2_02_FULL_57_9]|nr:MAG: glycosyl transferase family 2 [Elusimicrobia bacterium RIFCSPHIGHO2_02_FULL_57_9]